MESHARFVLITIGLWTIWNPCIFNAKPVQCVCTIQIQTGFYYAMSHHEPRKVSANHYLNSYFSLQNCGYKLGKKLHSKGFIIILTTLRYIYLGYLFVYLFLCLCLSMWVHFLSDLIGMFLLCIAPPVYHYKTRCPPVRMSVWFPHQWDSSYTSRG